MPGLPVVGRLPLLHPVDVAALLDVAAALDLGLALDDALDVLELDPLAGGGKQGGGARQFVVLKRFS